MKVAALHDAYTGLTAAQQKHVYLIATSQEGQDAYKTLFCAKAAHGTSIAECSSNKMSKGWFDGSPYERYIIWYYQDPNNECQWKYHERYSTNGVSGFSLARKLRQTMLTLIAASGSCAVQANTSPAPATTSSITTSTTTVQTTTLAPDGRCPIVIDVRTQSEWDAGHATCAHRLEIQYDTKLVAKLSTLANADLSHPVQLYCRSGNRAGVAQKILQDRKWTHVTNAGGWDKQANAIQKLCDCKTTTTGAKRSWMNIGSDITCDVSAGETYMKNSPGRGLTLAECKKSCEGAAGCQSITWFSRSGWCSHFSTPCTKTTRQKNAFVHRLSVSTAAPRVDTKRSWRVIGTKTACDTGAGEVYLPNSPGKGQTLSQCKKSCEDAAGCQSITYYYSNKWCSHFSTACTETKRKSKATALRLVADSVTTAPPKLSNRWVKGPAKAACDTGAGEVYLNSSPGKISNAEACKISCGADSKCQSITFFKSGWCSHFSTPCTKTKRNGKAVSIWRLISSKRRLRGF